MLTAAIGSLLSGKTQVTVTAVMVDSVGTACTPMEYAGPYLSTAGSFGMSSYSTQLYGTISGTGAGTGASTASRWDGDDLSVARVVSIGFDISASGAAAIAFIRKDGVAQTMTAFYNSNAPGTFANADLYLGAGAGILSAWTGVFGNIVIREGISTGADLLRVERFVGAQAGITI
jgi:hypothetical protein